MANVVESSADRFQAPEWHRHLDRWVKTGFDHGVQDDIILMVRISGEHKPKFAPGSWSQMMDGHWRVRVAVSQLEELDSWCIYIKHMPAVQGDWRRHMFLPKAQL